MLTHSSSVVEAQHCFGRLGSRVRRRLRALRLRHRRLCYRRLLCCLQRCLLLRLLRHCEVVGLLLLSVLRDRLRVAGAHRFQLGFKHCDSSGLGFRSRGRCELPLVCFECCGRFYSIGSSCEFFGSTYS